MLGLFDSRFNELELMVGRTNDQQVSGVFGTPRRCLSQFLKNSGSPRRELAGDHGGGEMETVKEKIFTTSVNSGLVP